MVALNRTLQPTGQVTPHLIERFLEELRSRIGSVTLAGTIYKVRRTSELLAPPRLNFAWLGEISRRTLPW